MEEQERWPYSDIAQNSELGQVLKRRSEIGGNFGQVQRRRDRWQRQLWEAEEVGFRARTWNYGLGFDEIDRILSDDDLALEVARAQGRIKLLTWAIERAEYFLNDLAPQVQYLNAEVDRLQGRRRWLEAKLSTPGPIYDDRDREVARGPLERELFELVGMAADVTTHPY